MTIRAVLDTNILTSGLFWHGPSGRLLDALAEGRFIGLTSTVLMREFEHVLIRDFEYSPEVARERAAYFPACMEIIEPYLSLEVVRLDPSDNRVLECALAGRADWIVTQDRRHLLSLKSYRGIELLTPQDALDRL